MRRYGTALLLMAMVAGMGRAAEPGLPAVIGATFQDESGKPVEGVKVAIMPPGEGERAAISAVSGKDGKMTLTVPMPEMLGYLVRMDIQKEGYPTFKVNQHIADNFKMEQAFQLMGVRKTVIHLRSSEGKPIEGAVLRMLVNPAAAENRRDRVILTAVYSPGGYWGPGTPATTDAKGDAVWEHGQIPQGFRITVGSEEKPLKSIESKDAEEVKVTLERGSFERLIPARVLAGKLVLANGKPATQWFVSGHVSSQGTTGVSGGIVQLFTTYMADRWVHPAADGSFEVRAPGTLLGLISPEGMQFLYVLNPDAWETPVHRMTLSVPALVGREKLHMVDAAGKDVTGKALRPTWMSSAGGQWQFVTDGERGRGVAGNSEWKMVSNEQGEIDFPVYAGANPYNFQIGEMRDRELGVYPQTMGQLDVTKSIVVRDEGVRRVTAPANVVVRHLTLALLDADGKAVTDVRELHLKAAGSLSDHGRSSYADTAGLHYFLREEERQLELEIPVGVYKRLRQNITLTDEPRQTVTIHVERGSPVKGRVLDAEGKPAAGATLSIYTKGVPLDRGTGGINALDIRATTDAEGRFEIASAPDECFTGVGYQGARIPELAITAETRTFEVRMPPTGSVRVLLPAGLQGPSPVSYSIVLAGAAPGGSGRADLRFDPVTQTYWGEGISPGRYHATENSIAGLKEIEAVETEVVAGKEAILDLRGRRMEALAQAPMRPVMVSVANPNGPYSGAEVAVFSDRFTGEMIQQRIDAWVRAQDAGSKQTALRSLQEVGMPAVEALPQGPRVRGQISPVDDLRLQLTDVHDGLELLASDLSDETGRMRFEGKAGRACVAVARVRGKLLGIKGFVIPEGEGAAAPVVISLEELRQVVAPGLAYGSPPRTYSFQIDKPEGIEGRILRRAISNDHKWGEGGFGFASARRAFGLTTYGREQTFDGLPVGMVISLQPPQAPGTSFKPSPTPITIEKGEGPMQLKAN